VSTPAAPLSVDELRPRLDGLTVVDVRTPGEYGSGHIPGVLNVPLDRLDDALPALRAAAGRGGGLAVVCASGGRSGAACERLAAAGISAASVEGGTDAWAERGHPLERPSGARTVWPMERQVRLAAGSLVLLGLLLDLAVPGFRVLSALIGAGLVFSALSNTCGMAAVLSKLPYNRRRPEGPGLEATLRVLAGQRDGGPAARDDGGAARP